jgi:hypothetical protein
MGPNYTKIIGYPRSHQFLNFITRAVSVEAQRQVTVILVAFGVSRCYPQSPASCRIYLAGYRRIDIFTDCKIIPSLAQIETTSVRLFSVCREQFSWEKGKNQKVVQ